MNINDNDRRSPYQGLIPYREEDATFFFGRRKETRLIIANLFAAPLTLLYGASGVGKSSILNAGVIHELQRREDVLVIPHRAWQSDPVAGLKEAVRTAALMVSRTEDLPSSECSLADYLD